MRNRPVRWNSIQLPQTSFRKLGAPKSTVRRYGRTRAPGTAEVCDAGILGRRRDRYRIVAERVIRSGHLLARSILDSSEQENLRHCEGNSGECTISSVKCGPLLNTESTRVTQKAKFT